MRSTGRVDKLNRGKRGMRSATISVVAVSCVSLLVFGSKQASAQNPSELRRRWAYRCHTFRCEHRLSLIQRFAS